MIIRNCTIRQSAYEFVLAFNNNRLCPYYGLFPLTVAKCKFAVCVVVIIIVVVVVVIIINSTVAVRVLCRVHDAANRSYDAGDYDGNIQVP